MTVRPNRRRGLAALELVLVFPMLIGVVVCILWVARVGIARTAAVSAARGEAWAKRAEADARDDSPTAGLVEHRARVAVPGRPGPRSAPTVAEGYAATVFGDGAARTPGAEK